MNNSIQSLGGGDAAARAEPGLAVRAELRALANAARDSPGRGRGGRGVERPRASSGRAQLRALTLGGAVWDAFGENANCGDPVGTLRGPCRVRVHFAGA